MSWFRVDNSAPSHPKIKALTDKAFRWWIIGLSYASQYLTNGRLPKVFWKDVPKQARAELTNGRLWDWDDPDFLIHDYLHHQSRKEDVEADRERNRENSKAYRDRRKAERRQQHNADANKNVSADASADRQHPVSDPENREHIQITDYREQTTPPASRADAAIMSPAEYDRLKKTHAFVGSKLRVPNALHSELLTKSGGNAERDLQRWYLDLNDRLEETNTGTGDVFAWLRPRHQSFAILKGWIEPAPKAGPVAVKHRGVADILAEREAAKGKAS